MLGYFHFAKLHLDSFDYAHFAKTLCLQRSLFEPILQKSMSMFPWLSPLWKSLCSRALAVSTILQKPLLTFFD
jgi:hypothetical protein